MPCSNPHSILAPDVLEPPGMRSHLPARHAGIRGKRSRRNSGEGGGIQRSSLRTAKAELARAGNQVASGFVRSSEDSKKIIRLLREIIVDYAGEMVLAGQRKDAEAGAVSSGSSQYQSMPMVKDGTNPFPITDSPTQEAMADSAIIKAKTRNSDDSGGTIRGGEDRNRNPIAGMNERIYGRQRLRGTVF